MQKGVLLRGIGGFYTVLGDSGECCTVRCKKKFRRTGLSPVAGDQVMYTPGAGEEDGWMEEILPRRSSFIRPPVANVSLLLIVVAPQPSPDLLLVDRLLMQCRKQEIKSLLVVNKCDLDGALAEQLAQEYRSAETEVCAVSAFTGSGLDALRASMAGETCCMTGQSGVGKSTLLNGLLGLRLETGDISRKILRGKNTTRQAELLVVDGLRVMDTAGFSLLELNELMEPVELKQWWPEFHSLEGRCRFEPCLHDREPGCAVSAAVQAGEISQQRVTRYRQLLQDVRQSWKDRYS